MIRNFIFWLLVAPASLAFLLGLIANLAQSMASTIKTADETNAETSQSLPDPLK